MTTTILSPASLFGLCGATLVGIGLFVVITHADLLRRVVSFNILGAGIFLGGWWAYHVLGWGGYWAWDPVENVSLLPWLTATA